MKRFLQFSLVLTVAAMLPNSLYGQAMIGYGINVARAGAAGVASGAGAAGIFSKLGSTAENAAKPMSGGARPPQPAFPDDDLKPTVIKLNTGAKPGISATSGTRKTSSGFTISGIPSSTASSAGNETATVREVAPSDSASQSANFDTGPDYAPAAPGSYQPVSGAGSAGHAAAAVQPEVAANEPAAETVENESTPETPSTASAESSSSPSAQLGRSSVVTSPTSPIGIAPEPASSAAASPASASPANDQASSSELEISVGDEVDQIIARFGEPMMALKGITGKDYTEKYLFRTADGLRITVLAVNGTVTAVLAGAKPAAATRAAAR